ncbi:hypothetical protein F5B22DRAFT_641153 [Xylaria bambusicola]|uniref:uncharacterized protein n=1 Tax=Xylaria bambusicola TaxID=326684 RepID=UPI00200878AC|nr:uncharacterized protein F5B22DRAFT_641153 [Xylaria bambusicola]KAI0528179.1 hypothetical protein F5B22DRAFT_641153 [Xylaria bambusicola]
MAQVYRERDIRVTRDRSRSSSGDESRYKTVSHYKVGGPRGTTTRLERVERYDDDDDRRSRYSHSHAGRAGPEVFEYDRRTKETIYPDRPRSAIDARGSDSYRTVEYEREVERDRDYYIPERQSRTRVVQETLSPTRDHYWERRPWDDHHDTDVRLEKRIVRRDSDGDLKVKEKTLDIHKDHHHPHHHDDHHDFKERDVKIERRYVEEREPREPEVERYRREVEYYTAPDPPPAPLVLRQKMPEQKVIVNEAPPPAPVIVPRADPTFIVLRDEHREPRRDDDYYRREDDRRYERDAYDEDYYIKRTVIRRDRSSSSDHHKKRHIAEGALAGAGLGALVGSRRGKDGEPQDHKGRKVLAGAALGALGTEVIRRARSAYDDRRDEYEYDDYGRHRHRSRSRSRSRSKSRSRLATGLAIGAAALAVAGGLKYMQNSKAEKEEAHRGRARRRYSNDSYSVSRSRSRRGRTRSKSNVAKAGAATAALAGLVHHYRSKSRSKSRAEIAAAGLTGAAATKLYERHKNKKDRENHEASDDEYYNKDRSISRSRSRSRSLGRHHHPRDTTADRELGLVHVPDVEYGSEPLSPYESASEEPRRRRRKHRQRHRSASGSDGEVRKKRSKSTLRDVAAAGLGTAAAAIGIKKYSDHQKNKDRGEKSSPDSIGHSRSRDRSDRARDRRSRDRYEEEAAAGAFYPGYDVEAPPPSPPHASGGFPPTNQAPPPPPAGPGGFTSHSNQSTANLNNPYPPYNPQDYANLPPPPPGPPPTTQYFPPPGGPGHHPGPENVSEVHPDGSGSTTTKQDGIKAKSRRSSSSSSSSSSASSVAGHKRTAPKVHFRPLSPESSRVLQKHHKTIRETTSDVADDADRSRHQDSKDDPPPSKRSSSDPSSSRLALDHRDRRARNVSSDSSDDDDVVDLPERFDSSGRPLDPRNRSLRQSRRPSYGSFEYRPQHPGDLHMRGNWATLPSNEHLDAAQLAQTIGGLLQGQGGFLGTLGHLIEHELKR